MRFERHKTPHGAMLIFPDVLQGSETWEKMRKGRPTASRFSDIVTAAKCELSKSSVAYAHELIAETFATDVAGGFIGNTWTDRGLELEEPARAAFAEHTGLEVVKVGFVTREDQFVGCSPDGMILDSATLELSEGLEMKCPAPKKHVEIVAGGVLPLDYRAQIHGALAITGMERWHFWSYCPGMKSFHCIVHRDAYTDKLSAAVDQFVIDLVALRQELIPRLKIQPAESNGIST